MSDAPSKPLGRPRLKPGELTIKQNCSFPVSVHDRLYTVARQQRLTVSEALRKAVERFIEEPDERRSGRG